jgi:hypothetical protein
MRDVNVPSEASRWTTMRHVAFVTTLQERAVGVVCVDIPLAVGSASPAGITTMSELSPNQVIVPFNRFMEEPTRSDRSIHVVVPVDMFLTARMSV